MNDPELSPMVRPRFQDLYAEIGQAHDEERAVQELSQALPKAKEGKLQTSLRSCQDHRIPGLAALEEPIQWVNAQRQNTSEVCGVLMNSSVI
jgi:hypothetical protein